MTPTTKPEVRLNALTSQQVASAFAGTYSDIPGPACVLVLKAPHERLVVPLKADLIPWSASAVHGLQLGEWGVGAFRSHLGPGRQSPLVIARLLAVSELTSGSGLIEIGEICDESGLEEWERCNFSTTITHNGERERIRIVITGAGYFGDALLPSRLMEGVPALADMILAETPPK